MCAIPADAYVLIIGAMKCGTSSLFSYLAQHPAICPCRVKEPEYFSRQGHRVAAKTYEELWQFDPAQHRYAMEGSTGYTKFPSEHEVPARIRDYGLKPRFIYVMRDPFARIESHNNFARSNRRWNPGGVTGNHSVSISDYHLQLEQYRPYFARERFLLLDFDELKVDPPSVLRQVCRFLDIPDPPVQPVPEVVNETRRVSDAVVSIKRSALGPVASRLPQPLKDAGRRLLERISPPRLVKLSPSQRAEIHERLAPGMARLRDDYGVDVSKWGF